jgi:Cu/Ag efflux protein CusF
MGKILICCIGVAVLALWAIYHQLHPAGSIVLPAEGTIKKIDPSTGEVDIQYSANIPECYPLLGVSKVSNMDMLKGIKEGDHVLYEFNAVRLPVRSTGPFLPFHKREIISIKVVTDQNQWGRGEFLCRSEMFKQTGQ